MNFNVIVISIILKEWRITICILFSGTINVHTWKLNVVVIQLNVSLILGSKISVLSTAEGFFLYVCCLSMRNKTHNTRKKIFRLMSVLIRRFHPVENAFVLRVCLVLVFRLLLYRVTCCFCFN